MYITKFAALLSLAASALSLPTGEVQKRALTVRPYADFQVSSGTAGNALAEAQAKFPVSPNRLGSPQCRGISSNHSIVSRLTRAIWPVSPRTT